MVLLAVALPLTDQFAWDVLLVMLVPFLALALARLRPAVNWTLFALIAVASILTLGRIERSESSTAGFGVIVVPLLLTLGVLLAAVIDRFYEASAQKPHG